MISCLYTKFSDCDINLSIQMNFSSPSNELFRAAIKNISNKISRNSSMHLCLSQLHGGGRILLITIYGSLEYRYCMKYQHNYNRIKQISHKNCKQFLLACGFELTRQLIRALSILDTANIGCRLRFYLLTIDLLDILPIINT
jgi:hypothetical protein